MEKGGERDEKELDGGCFAGSDVEGAEGGGGGGDPGARGRDGVRGKGRGGALPAGSETRSSCLSSSTGSPNLQAAVVAGEDLRRW